MIVQGAKRTTIRSLRLQLALALRELRPDDEEVLTLLQRALSDREPTPSDYQIHLEIGTTLLRRNERSGAFVAFSRAVASDPREGQGAADAAIQLLDGADAASLAMALPENEARALDSAVWQSEDKPDAVCRLAAKLRLARGDAAAAIEMLERQVKRNRTHSPDVETELASALIDEARPDEALQYLDRLPAKRTPEQLLLRATALLDSGLFKEAQAAAQSIIDLEPSARPVLALALFGLGEPEHGLKWVIGASASRDSALAEAIIRLHIASTQGADVDPVATSEANDAAVAAARFDPSNPDALLVRGQVSLEASLDVDEGRRLLASAVQRKPTILERSRWLRFQERARAGNAWFQYFQVELALAAKREDRVLELASVADRGSTTYAQDAALDSIVAEIHRRRGQTVEAASSYSAAATAYDKAGNLAHALKAGHQALTLEPAPERILFYVDGLWRWTYQPLTVDQVDTAISDALQLVDSLDGELSTDLTEQAALLKGLLLYRRSEFAKGQRADRSWQAVPWLLLAIALKPEEPYTPAHVAWAFDRSRCPRAALHFADRAYRLGPQYAFIQEVTLAMRFNYFGRLDPATDRLARAYEADTKWRDSLLLMAALMDGKVDSLDERALSAEAFDALWAHEVSARIRALKDGVDSSRNQLEAVRKEAEQPPQSWGTAVDMSLLLGEPTRARELVRAGTEAHDMSEVQLHWAESLIELVTNAGGLGEAELAKLIKDEDLPYNLRSIAYAELPVFKRIVGCPPTLTASIDRLIQIARDRLADLEKLPPVTADFVNAKDPEIRQLVEKLFEIVERIDGGRPQEASSVANDLASRQPSGWLGSALRGLQHQLDSKPALKPEELT